MDKTKDGCEICGKKFNAMFVSEHQCKRCARNVCKECCTKKKPIFTKSSFKLEEHRCCDACFPISTANMQYIKQNNIAFLADSERAKQWVELASIDVMAEDKKQPMASTYKLSFIKLGELWGNLSDTMRELVGSSLGKTPIAQAEELIENIIAKHRLKINQEHSLLLLFVLCHASENSAMKIFHYLLGIAAAVSEERVIELLGLHSPAHHKSLKHIVANMRNQLVHSLFLEIFPTTIVQEIVLEVLLAGTPAYLETLVAWLIGEYQGHFLSAPTAAQVKTHIYQNIDRNTLMTGVKTIRKRMLHHSKQQKKTETEPNHQQSEEMHIKISSATPENEEVVRKINEAAEFLRKLEQGELNEEEINFEDMENLNQYLDQIIAQNDQAIQQCEHFDSLLTGIQEEMYKKNERQ